MARFTATSQVDDALLASDLQFAPLLSREEKASAIAIERERVSKMLRARGWALRNEAGACFIRHLDWDSTYFGHPCADLQRLYLHEDASPADLIHLLNETIATARTEQIQLLSARLPAHRPEVLNLLIAQAFQVVDCSVEIGTTAAAGGDTPSQVRAARPGDLPDLERIADTFTKNRFYTDRRIEPSVARGVYRSWVEQAVQGQYGELLVAEKDDGSVAGFATFAVDRYPVPIGCLGLIAIAPPSRGCGYFDALVRACRLAANRALGQEAAVFYTSTQLSNIPALRAFARQGLFPFGSRYVLHGWLDDRKR